MHPLNLLLVLCSLILQLHTQLSSANPDPIANKAGKGAGDFFQGFAGRDSGDGSTENKAGKIVGEVITDITKVIPPLRPVGMILDAVRVGNESKTCSNS
jgi:hypothetical protein